MGVGWAPSGCRRPPLRAVTVGRTRDGETVPRLFFLFFSFPNINTQISVARGRFVWRGRALSFFSVAVCFFPLFFGSFRWLSLSALRSPPRKSGAVSAARHGDPTDGNPERDNILKEKKRDRTSTGRARRRQARPGLLGVGGGTCGEKGARDQEDHNFFLSPFFSFCIRLRLQGRADLHGTLPHSLARACVCVCVDATTFGRVDSARPVDAKRWGLQMTHVRTQQQAAHWAR
nr:hypothetical protein [Pandoravirus belohorizontensis]